MGTVGELFRATLRYSNVASSQGQNVFHWRLDTANDTDAAIVAAILSWVNTDWGNKWAGVASDDASLDDFTVQALNFNGTIKRQLGTTTVSITGANGPTGEAAAVSGLIAVDTARPTTVGRKYIPFPGDVSLTSGLFNAATLAQFVLMQADWAQVLVTGGGGDLTPVIFRLAAQAVEDILVAGPATNIPAYQRRRKPGVGV